ncbi:MAG: TonB C-terminal domain-containing protein, partial [Anaerolineae bacterium]|nr:TonB C-terminal domain-containing protein [Anaerolineae bacterium]
MRPDGSIERYRLAQSTGDPERDRAIEAALGRIGRFSQPPPAELPQPVSLRLV